MSQLLVYRCTAVLYYETTLLTLQGQMTVGRKDSCGRRLAILLITNLQHFPQTFLTLSVVPIGWEPMLLMGA